MVFSFTLQSSLELAPSCFGMMSGSSWAWLNVPWSRLASSLTRPAPVLVSSFRPGQGSISDPLVLLSFLSLGDTSVFAFSSFLTPGRSGVCESMGTSFSSPCLLFKPSLDTGSCWWDTATGEYLLSQAPLTSSPSDSEPEAELLSDAERDGDFFSGFSSFFLFFFFFLAACLLCFLYFVSLSVFTQLEWRNDD